MKKETEIFAIEPPEKVSSGPFTYTGCLRDGAVNAISWVRNNPTDAAVTGLLVGASIDMTYALSQMPDFVRMTGVFLSATSMLFAGAIMNEYSEILRGKRWGIFNKIGSGVTLTEGLAGITGQGMMLSGNQDLMLPGLLVSGAAALISMLHLAGTVDHSTILSEEEDVNNQAWEAFDQMIGARYEWEGRFGRYRSL